MPESLTWKFNELDLNNDKVLSDKELNPFIKEIRQLNRKVGKNVDNSENHDGMTNSEFCAYSFKDNCKIKFKKDDSLKISEWQSCLNSKYWAFLNTTFSHGHTVHM